jgi:CO/xanthine dehydrogenase FAD-binding subunit
MARFDYVRPASVPEAVTLLNDPGHRCRVLAGGTDMLVYMRHRAPDFDRVVDVSLLSELHTIAREGDTLKVGAAVTFAEVVESRLLAQAAPFLVEACRLVGGPAIRNSGTLGGNVVNAAACADSLPVLVALDAVVQLRSAAGERSLPVTEFVTKPNRTQLQPGELLLSLVLQAPPAGARTTFIKVGRRNAQAISRLTVAAAGRTDAAGKVDYVRVAPGAATPQITRFAPVEAFLLGKSPDAVVLHEAGQVAAETMIAITGRRWSAAWKEPALAAMTERALTEVFAPAAPIRS